jgi:hypothetical protein
LNNKIEDIDILERSGVYKIECSNCNQIYVGQSGRSLKTRLKEHWDFKRPSHVANHMSHYGHQTNIDNAEILHLYQKGKRLDVLVAFEIKLNSLKAPLINQQINILNSPLLDIPLNLHYDPCTST